MTMEPIYLIFIIVFIIGAYLYHTKATKQRSAHFSNMRKHYLAEHPDLQDDKRDLLERGYPWVGMDCELLNKLFGEPYRKRPMNEDASQTIWTYPRIYVLVKDNQVRTWNDR